MRMNPRDIGVLSPLGPATKQRLPDRPACPAQVFGQLLPRKAAHLIAKTSSFDDQLKRHLPGSLACESADPRLHVWSRSLVPVYLVGEADSQGQTIRMDQEPFIRGMTETGVCQDLRG